ncbi:MAG: LOG family protein [Mariprofundaceae bacterium]
MTDSGTKDGKTIHPSNLSDLPEKLRPHVQGLLDALEHDSPYKRSLLLESMRLIASPHNTADMKMVSSMIQEIRKGLDVFEPYQAVRKVAVFGSARTAVDDPRYQQAKKCASILRDAGLMVITGGGGGIMQAANEGAGEARSFAININLPLEQFPNAVVDGSARHFYCKYFFTRKLFFLKESDAVILAPGGFGTLDEGFETLTLLQTGRTPPIPVVLLEAPGDDYWGPLVNSWMRRLVDDKLIGANDHHFLYHTDSAESAMRHITSFYSNYDSFRYVGEWVLLRIVCPLSDAGLARLNAEFSDVLNQGEIEQVLHWPKSDDKEFDHLPRLRMKLDRGRMNVLPGIIRRMNALVEHENHAEPS